MKPSRAYILSKTNGHCAFVFVCSEDDYFEGFNSAGKHIATFRLKAWK